MLAAAGKEILFIIVFGAKSKNVAKLAALYIITNFSFWCKTHRALLDNSTWQSVRLKSPTLPPFPSFRVAAASGN